MANYIRTGPFVNGSVPGISAAFLNAIESVLEHNSGETETGKYFLNYNAYANVAQGGTYTCSISRTAIPVSAVIDTVDQGATNCGAPATSSISANGFMNNCAATGVATNCRVAGNYTITY